MEKSLGWKLFCFFRPDDEVVVVVVVVVLNEVSTSEATRVITELVALYIFHINKCMVTMSG